MTEASGVNTYRLGKPILYSPLHLTLISCELLAFYIFLIFTLFGLTFFLFLSLSVPHLFFDIFLFHKPWLKSILRGSVKARRTPFSYFLTSKLLLILYFVFSFHAPFLAPYFYIFLISIFHFLWSLFFLNSLHLS